MADFRGMTVQITLKHPPGVVLHGRVKELVAGQTLTLQDATGAHWENWVVQSTAIQDLGVIDTTPQSMPPGTTRHNAAVPSAVANAHTSQPPKTLRPTPVHAQHTSSAPPAAARAHQASFTDPAILSYGKSTVESSRRQASSAGGEASSAVKDSWQNFENAPQIVQDQKEPLKDVGPQSLRMGNVADGQQTHNGEDGARKKVRRGQKNKNAQFAAQATPVVHDPPPIMNAEVSRNGNDMNGAVRRGKGWRQGPFLQPSPHNLSPSESHGTTKQTKNRKQRRGEAEKQQNGWATEDATDIQDLGDFDFEASLKLFDKKQVFEELRQGDTTADEDRLVSHNKIHRPGTYGGKNLHPTENVLSPPLVPKNMGNELESSSDADTELNLANGRSSSKVSLSRASAVPSKHRQSSLKLDGKSHAVGGPTSSDRGLTRAATSLSIASRGRKQLSSVVTSPQPDRNRSPQSAVSFLRKKANLSATAREPHFSVVRTLANCPVLHPMALETLEGETILQYGMTQDAITDSRGRKQLSSVVTSPQPDRNRSPQSAVSILRKKANLSATAREPHFSVVRTLANCPVLHPMALETLEGETILQYGMTQDAITECAARSVAETAMGMFDGAGGSRRVSRANTARGSMTSSMTLDRTSVPVVVILVGNHVTGARAAAAARHIVCRNAQIIIAEAQHGSDNAQDPSMRIQTAIVKRMMKAGASIKRGPWKKASNYIKNLSGPPAVIIDALLAGSTYHSLSTANTPQSDEHQKEVREMIEWANRSRAPVLSIGCPSGVSGVDGSAPVVEGEPLAVRPEKVLSLGVPMLGLLEAMKNGERWDVSLADIGINIALRPEEAVTFGAQWVAELTFTEADTTI
nr:enhancer of mrna-decapping protein 3 [Quercus suber]